MTRFLIAMVLVAAAAGPARAQETPPEVDADLATHGTITGAALLGTGLFMLIPVKSGTSWGSELFGAWDLGVRDNYSTSAAKTADTLVAVTLVAPAMLQLDDGDALLVYGESLAINLLLNNAAKYLVQRPRPYTYNPDARVEAVERAQGKDARLSFYSGHSSMAFGAAVSGVYLYALDEPDETARAFAWGVGLAAATATANLRVRAGKHYYSDVIIGGVIGAGVGYLVPALHTRGDVYVPSGVELAAMAGGVLVGAVGSQLLPMKRDVLLPLDGGTGATKVSLQFTPMVLSGGGGLAAVGVF